MKYKIVLKLFVMVIGLISAICLAALFWAPKVLWWLPAELRDVASVYSKPYANFQINKAEAEARNFQLQIADDNRFSMIRLWAAEDTSEIGCKGDMKVVRRAAVIRVRGKVKDFDDRQVLKGVVEVYGFNFSVDFRPQVEADKDYVLQQSETINEIKGSPGYSVADKMMRFKFIITMFFLAAFLLSIAYDQRFAKRIASAGLVVLGFLALTILLGMDLLYRAYENTFYGILCAGIVLSVAGIAGIVVKICRR